MNVEDVRKMVEVDLVIDESNLHEESLKTPQLHNKYLVYLENSKLALQMLLFEEKKLKKLKWLYYTGKLCEEDLREKNWEPFEYNILKTDIPIFLESDEDLNKLKAKLEIQRSLVNYLEEVIKIINSRQWNIKSAIEWIKFTQGV
mgnify:CR=1 FL=1